MARALIAVGVPAERAYDLARRVEDDLASRGEQLATLDRVEELAGDGDGDALHRLRRFLALQELDVPLVILIGGATGTGKSTVATELAYRLGITRVTSTDFIRQTMRAFFARKFMPSIHYSSFEAGSALRSPKEAVDPTIAGFLEQSRSVLVGVRASVDRALEENWSMVLEGIHLVPGQIELPRSAAKAVLAQCVLEIADADEHASHFYVRDATTARPVRKYVDRFDEIRRIQDEIRRRAIRHRVPVIESSDVDVAVTEVLDLVLAAVDRLDPVV